jgi:uncharacterized membrane protein YcaP (DUF421 family)
MDPLRIVVRIVFLWSVLQVFLRLSGKRAVKHASPFDFTVALILGDMMDDLIWAEVQASVFVVATGTLMLIHVGFDLLRYRAGLLER